VGLVSTGILPKEIYFLDSTWGRRAYISAASLKGALKTMDFYRRIHAKVYVTVIDGFDGGTGWQDVTEEFFEPDGTLK
jgi:hypothetical protein